MSLKREDAMTHAPDLLLLSQYDPELGEVAAFEELIGSHGGLGGPQTEPFILHPVEWTLDEEVPLGAPAIYRNIRRWLGRSASSSASTAARPLRRPDTGRGHGGHGARSGPAEPSWPSIHYDADGAVAAERFIAALTDFGPRRPELWPNLDDEVLRAPRGRRHVGRCDRGYRLLGGVWAHERYDWSERGHRPPSAGRGGATSRRARDRSTR